MTAVKQQKLEQRVAEAQIVQSSVPHNWRRQSHRRAAEAERRQAEAEAKSAVAEAAGPVRLSLQIHS